MMKKLDHDDLLFKVNNPYTEGLRDEPKGERFEVIRARLNIKTVLSTYGDFHVEDKTAVRTSYL